MALLNLTIPFSSGLHLPWKSRLRYPARFAASSALLPILRLQLCFCAASDALRIRCGGVRMPPMLMTRRLPPFWLCQPTPRWLMPPRLLWSPYLRCSPQMLG
ncbi:hypothetical protein KCP76_00835 [Salmonella enterica subsp. enterica serovar Weltevreden]|nr:hypothetical protein KCP76_00835 [Salmonella enterica subsp. enterica serovar Weltevreden]